MGTAASMKLPVGLRQLFLLYVLLFGASVAVDGQQQQQKQQVRELQADLLSYRASAPHASISSVTGVGDLIDYLSNGGGQPLKEAADEEILSTLEEEEEDLELVQDEDGVLEEREVEPIGWEAFAGKFEEVEVDEDYEPKVEGWEVFGGDFEEEEVDIDIKPAFEGWQDIEGEFEDGDVEGWEVFGGDFQEVEVDTDNEPTVEGWEVFGGEFEEEEVGEEEEESDWELIEDETDSLVDVGQVEGWEQFEGTFEEEEYDPEEEDEDGEKEVELDLDNLEDFEEDGEEEDGDEEDADEEDADEEDADEEDADEEKGKEVELDLDLEEDSDKKDGDKKEGDKKEGDNEEGNEEETEEEEDEEETEEEDGEEEGDEDVVDQDTTHETDIIDDAPSEMDELEQPENDLDADPQTEDEVEDWKAQETSEKDEDEGDGHGFGEGIAEPTPEEALESVTVPAFELLLKGLTHHTIRHDIAILHVTEYHLSVHLARMHPTFDRLDLYDLPINANAIDQQLLLGFSGNAFFRHDDFITLTADDLKDSIEMAFEVDLPVFVQSLGDEDVYFDDVELASIEGHVPEREPEDKGETGTSTTSTVTSSSSSKDEPKEWVKLLGMVFGILLFVSALLCATYYYLFVYRKTVAECEFIMKEESSNGSTVDDEEQSGPKSTPSYPHLEMDSVYLTDDEHEEYIGREPSGKRIR